MRNWIDIVESLSGALPITWEQRSMTRWFGTFMANEEYFIECYQTSGFNHPDDKRGIQQGNWYDLAFGITRDGLAGNKVIGSGRAEFRIFATVIDGFRQFINEVNPEFIMLSASKENDNRLSLYQRMARRFSADLAKLSYEPVEAPDHQYANVRAVADTLAWRRRGAWKPLLVRKD